MNTGLQVVNGFAFGFGMLIAVVLFRLMFHTGFCG